MSGGQVTAARRLRPGGLWQRLAVLLALSAAALAWAGIAEAGFARQPASGSKISPRPTFVVQLDPSDSLPTVYVSTSTAMSSSYVPNDEVGSCTPSTPTGEADTFSCQPSFYRPDFGSALKPGVYVWWLTFWRTDPGAFAPSLHISGPLQVTVPTPVAPSGVSLVAPPDGADAGSAPTLLAHAPANATISFHASDENSHEADGSPTGVDYADCTVQTTVDGQYSCALNELELLAGTTYYWWVVVTVGDSSFVYGPRSFIYRPAPTGGGGGTGGGEGGGHRIAPPHEASYAPYLPSSSHYRGKSVKQTRLSLAAYKLSKLVGVPHTVAVACWSVRDWANISHDNPESVYTTLGLHLGAMPRWLHLSPTICRSIETLLYHRPQYPNAITANGMDTLTHEMIHALGVGDEAKTECFAMQLSYFTDTSLGIPGWYASRLAHLSLGNYGYHPPRYINRAACRENGAWDLFPGRNSLPWHDFDF